jgi:hypothetical protein
VHRDLDGRDGRVTKAGLGNSVGESLDQVERSGGDVVDDGLGESTVVDRVLQVVTRRRGGQVERAGQVDDEPLALAAFEVEDAMMTEGGDAGQGDRVRMGCRHDTSSSSEVTLSDQATGPEHSLFP